MSPCWEVASLQKAHRFKSIYLLLNGDDRLLDFIFHPSRPKLRKPSRALLKEARNSRDLSKQESWLIQAALDLWDPGSTKVPLIELLLNLEHEQIVCLLESICHYEEIPTDILKILDEMEYPTLNEVKGC